MQPDETTETVEIHQTEKIIVSKTVGWHGRIFLKGNQTGVNKSMKQKSSIKVRKAVGKEERHIRIEK